MHPIRYAILAASIAVAVAFGLILVTATVTPAAEKVIGYIVEGKIKHADGREDFYGLMDPRGHPTLYPNDDECVAALLKFLPQFLPFAAGVEREYKGAKVELPDCLPFKVEIEDDPA